MNRPGGISEHLLLFTHCSAVYNIGDITLNARPGQMIVIPANTPYSYHSVESHYVDDWFHFTCDAEETSAIAELFNKNISFANPERIGVYFPQLLWEYNEGHRENCHNIFRILFCHAADALENMKSGITYGPYLASLQELRLKLISSPETDITSTSASRQLGISVSHFEHLYREYFGTSFRNDLITMRINYAKTLLAGTDDTVLTIATLCGYQNEVHFYRQFKKIIGLTPSQYRRMATEPARSRN